MMQSKMLVIGITGGIGTGKTTVLDMITEHYNAYCVPADDVAKMLQTKGQYVYDRIVDHFGREVLSEDEEINRDTLRSIVMNDQNELFWLNELIHPEVKKYILNDIETKRAESDIDYYVIEAALLIQDGYKDICDVMIAVTADREVRISRIIESRGYDREKALSFMKNQPESTFYSENSDMILDNSGSYEETLTGLEKVFKNIEKNYLV